MSHIEFRDRSTGDRQAYMKSLASNYACPELRYERRKSCRAFSANLRLGAGSFQLC